MRKIVALALFAAFAAGGAFAQLTLSGGIDLAVVPLQVVTRHDADYEGVIWLGAGAGAGENAGIRTRLSLMASHEERFGFRTDVFFMSATGDESVEAGLGDIAGLWMRPLDWLRLDVGWIANGSLAGQVTGYWLSSWTVGMFGGGNIFTPHVSSDIGFLAGINLPQVEGLSVYVFIPGFGTAFTRDSREFAWLPDGLLAPAAETMGQGDNEHRALRVFQRARLSAGYRVSDQLFARVQFVGENPSGSINWMTGPDTDRRHVGPYRYRISMAAPRAEAAVTYSIPGFLVLDVGVRSWLPISNWITGTWNEDPHNQGFIRGGHPGTFWGGVGFGAAALFSLTEQLSLGARLDGTALRTWTGPHKGVERIVNPVGLSFHVWPSYRLAGGMVVTAGVGVNFIGRNTVEMVDGSNPNEGLAYWERSLRLRAGGGASVSIPLFGGSFVNVGLAYRHGTADIHGGEPRVLTLPINFVYNW